VRVNRINSELFELPLCDFVFFVSFVSKSRSGVRSVKASQHRNTVTPGVSPQLAKRNIALCLRSLRKISHF